MQVTDDARAERVALARRDINAFCRYVMTEDQAPPVVPYSDWSRLWTQNPQVQYVRIPDHLIGHIQSGRISGLSIGGYAQRRTIVAQPYQAPVRISHADVLLAQLDCFPPHRTATGAWRVGSRRFRTKYLAALWLKKNSGTRKVEPFFKRALREVKAALDREIDNKIIMAVHDSITVEV